MRRLLLALAAASFAATLPPPAALAQEPQPASLAPAALADAQGTRLIYPWRFRAGDAPDWAAADFDDSDWTPLSPLLPADALPPGGWPGVGWFRRHLRIDERLWGTPLEMTLQAVGTAEVYLDGELLFRADTRDPSGPRGSRPARLGPWPFSFSPHRDHVLAVRYVFAPPAASAAPPEQGFVLTLRREGGLAAARRTGEVLVALTGALAFSALLHLALYLFYRRLPENLFFGLLMLALALLLFRDYALLSFSEGAWPAQLNRLLAPLLPLVATLFALLTYYAVRANPVPRSWRLFAVALVPLAPAVAMAPEPFATWTWFSYMALVMAEIVRVERSGRTVEREGGIIVLLGLALLFACVTLQVLGIVGLVNPVGGFRYVYAAGVLAAAGAMSLFLARSFARTSLHLEHRLAEVEGLARQVLEHERQAHNQELRARLLEAENLRKSRELEAARALQLSMLPSGLPKLDGIDVAAAMTTASEIGGDSYDFRVEAGGAMVAAVGDATGHGVAAGIMVTAVKALFAALPLGPDLGATLAECDRVVRGLNVRRRHMCLALARVTPRALTVCSAAMPPALIHRAATGIVEEVGAGALPLGGQLSPSYEQHTVTLYPGDTVLLASDGLYELPGPAGDAFGFDRAATALRAAAAAPAQEVVALLSAAAAAWRGEREQADDLTLVVLQVS